MYQTFNTNFHGVAVILPANDHEIPGSTPGRYNLQIKITSRERDKKEKKRKSEKEKEKEKAWQKEKN